MKGGMDMLRLFFGSGAKTAAAAAVIGGAVGILCSVVTCVKLCMMEQMLCSSEAFRSKL